MLDHLSIRCGYTESDQEEPRERGGTGDSAFAGAHRQDAIRAEPLGPPDTAVGVAIASDFGGFRLRTASTRPAEARREEIFEQALLEWASSDLVERRALDIPSDGQMTTDAGLSDGPFTFPSLDRKSVV